MRDHVSEHFLRMASEQVQLSPFSDIPRGPSEKDVLWEGLKMEKGTFESSHWHKYITIA